MMKFYYFHIENYIATCYNEIKKTVERKQKMQNQSKRPTGNSAIREMNRKKILTYIRRNSPVSRHVMCKEIGISAATATRIVEQLLKEGLVRESSSPDGEGTEKTEVVKRSVGRNPVALELVSEAKYCFGINLSKQTLGIALIDFCLNTVDKYVTSTSDIMQVDELLQLIGDVVEGMITSRKLSKKKIMGFGVGTPGFVDTRTGNVEKFAISKFASLPIKKYLENRFGLPAIVDNNANTRMLGEQWTGFASHCKNAIFVVNSEGVGSGILCNGHILKNTNRYTAGLGHISVNFEGELCTCGSRGCVELYCGTEYLEKKAFRITGEKERFSYRELAKLVEQGDERFVPLFETAAMAMSSGLTSLITIICPEVIILSGNLFDVSDYYYERVVELTKEKIGIITYQPVFQRRRVRDGIYEIGAAALFFQNYFDQ